MSSTSVWCDPLISSSSVIAAARASSADASIPAVAAVAASAIAVGKAVSYIHENYPHVVVDGELQADFALNPEMLAKEFPFSKLNGKKTNVLIFPNLESANITYKLLKEVYKAESLGPIILGFSKPVHVMQLGASVDEMVNMAALAVVDAQEKERRKMK